ncbi:hypothetical protein ACJW30_01G084700 [Castanea mollissima]
MQIQFQHAKMPIKVMELGTSVEFTFSFCSASFCALNIALAWAFSAFRFFLSKASFALFFSSNLRCSFNLAASSSLLNSSAFLANSSSSFVSLLSSSLASSISSLPETVAKPFPKRSGFTGFLDLVV